MTWPSISPVLGEAARVGGGASGPVRSKVSGADAPSPVSHDRTEREQVSGAGRQSTADPDAVGMTARRPTSTLNDPDASVSARSQLNPQSSGGVAVGHCVTDKRS